MHLSVHAQDEAAYVAGERAGLLRAFRETLPSQQLLGSCCGGIQRLQMQVDQDRLHARAAESSLAELATKMQVCCCVSLLSDIIYWSFSRKQKCTVKGRPSTQLSWCE